MTDDPHRQRTDEAVDDSPSAEPFAAYVEPISQLLPKTPVLHRIRDSQLLEVVGRGGMGTVYKARHLRLGKVRAVKVLSPQLLDNQEAVERFRLEIENCGRLEHPNIVQALDAGEEHGIQFLVMEFVEGMDLAQLASAYQQQSRAIPIATACALVRQAAQGLHHAHQHFLVHRDIKPSNLMLSKSGTVKILDLGLARFVAEHLPGTRLTLTHSPMGTCDYMAPEQWSDASAVDIRADIYSLGCTLYFLLTGKPPYAGENFRSLAKKQLAHQHAPLPDVQQERPDVPAELSSVLRRMMAKLPEDRFREPLEVVQALDPLVGPELKESELASLTGALQRSARPTDLHLPSSLTETHRIRPSAPGGEPLSAKRRRRQVWRWATALLLFVFLALGSWMLFSLGRGPSRLPDEVLAENLVSLPGLNGKWWFDEMPWYTPFVRIALVRGIARGDATEVLGPETATYLDPDIPGVQRWLLGATDRCRPQLSLRQRALLDALIAISREELDDEQLKQRLSASYQDFAAGGATSEPEPADRYTLAVLEHKLAELGNDQALAERALASYDAAAKLLDALPDPQSRLGLLCRADSACLCYMVLRDFDAASERFEQAAVADAPLLLRVEALASYGQAGRVAGRYEKDEALNLAQRIVDASALAPDHPLRAHVRERWAWSLMDQWKVEQAYQLFVEAHSLREFNRTRNPLAAIYVLHNLHGKAMAQRYRGKVAAARAEYEEVLAKINVELTAVARRDVRPTGRQRYAWDLRERQSNALERRADCELYEGAASAPQSVKLREAADNYQQAGELAVDPAAQVVHACKSCLCLALRGDVAAAEDRFSRDEVRARAIIGQGQERVRIARQLTAAVLAYKKAADPAGGRDALRRFLDRLDLDPYPADRLRRENLEMQLLALELLISSQSSAPDAPPAPLEDVERLDRLLTAFEHRLESYAAVEGMLPFLRRFFELGISASGEQAPERTRRLILASRGPGRGLKPDALNILFQVQAERTFVVGVWPDGTTEAFRLEGVGRERLKQQRAGGGGRPLPPLPADLVRAVAAAADAGTPAACLWLDDVCWPDTQQQAALVEEDFPWPEVREKVVLQ